MCAMTQTLLESERSVRGKIEQMEREASAWRALAQAAPASRRSLLAAARRVVGIGMIRVGRRLTDETAGAVPGRRTVRNAV